MKSANYSDNFYQSSDGLRLYFRDYPCQSPGASDPVICLPGLTRNSLDFRALAGQLATTRRIISPDLRGRGDSEHDPDRRNYHPAQYVADIWTLLQHLKLDKVVVIGTSLGGWMAMVMAHERPASIVAVVMNDIGPEVDRVGIERILASAGTLPPVLHWAQAAQMVKNHYGVSFPDWNDGKWLEYARTTYRQCDAGGLDVRLDRDVGKASREGLSGLRQEPWQLFAALVPIPLLLLRGEQSDILNVATVEKMKTVKPDLIAVTVKNRGHAPYLDEPEAVNAIEEFLSDK